MDEGEKRLNDRQLSGLMTRAYLFMGYLWEEREGMEDSVRILRGLAWQYPIQLPRSVTWIRSIRGAPWSHS